MPGRRAARAWSRFCLVSTTSTTPQCAQHNPAHSTHIILNDERRLVVATHHKLIIRCKLPVTQRTITTHCTLHNTHSTLLHYIVYIIIASLLDLNVLCIYVYRVARTAPHNRTDRDDVPSENVIWRVWMMPFWSCIQKVEKSVCCVVVV